MALKWKLMRQFHQEEYKLVMGTNTIGRGFDANVQCASLFVSRTHCILELSENTIKIFDNKSSNGTFVNHSLIPTSTYYTLNENDIIGLGVTGEVYVGEEFFVFKLIHDKEEKQSNFENCEKRLLENVSNCEDNKRIKLDEDANKIDDNLILNYTQSDNDIVEISDDENSVAQVFEKSFKSSAVRESIDQAHELPKIDVEPTDDNNEIICIDSDNEEEDVNKWINKLSQNIVLKSEIAEDNETIPDLEIEIEEIKALPLSQNLLKMIEEDALSYCNDSTKNDNLIDLEEYDFIANTEKEFKLELKNLTISSETIPPKKEYTKPPIIEAPILRKERKGRTDSSSISKTDKINKIKKILKKDQNSKKSKCESSFSSRKIKNKSSSKFRQIDKEEKKTIGQMRKDRLKELADKLAVQKDKSSSIKNVSKPKVKVTEKNRGTFLTDPIENATLKKDHKKIKLKELKCVSKISDLPRIPKKNVNDSAEAKNDYDSPCASNLRDSFTNTKDVKDDSIHTKNKVNASFSKVYISSTSKEDTVDKGFNNKSTPQQSNAQLKDISNIERQSNNNNNIATIIKSCLKSGQKSKTPHSVKITVMPKIRYFEIEEGNTLNRCTVKDLPFNWQDKKRSTPAICSQTAAVQSVENIDNVIALITTWNPLWLEEQKSNPELPPLLAGTEYKRSVLRHSYTTYPDYEKTIFPLMVDELWASVSKEWDNRSLLTDERQKKAYSIGIDQTIPDPGQQNVNKSNVMIIHCHMLLNKTEHEKGIHPREGDYIVIGLVQNSGTRDGQVPKNKITTNIRKRFAFVNNAKKVIAKKQEVNQSLLKFTKQPYGILYLELKTKNKPLNLNMKEPMVAYIISYINPLIRNFKAILALPNSKLCTNILSPKIEKFTKPSIDDSNCVNMISSLTALNQAQKKAVMDTVADCLLPEPMITLIQGPPGTGKSRVIVSMIQQLLYGEKLRPSKRPKILICAPSNAAIDEIVCRLLFVRQSITVNKFKMVRFGVLESMNPRVQDISLQTLSERDVATQIANMRYEDTDSIETEKRFLEAKINSLKLAIENMVKSNQSTHVAQDKLNKCERKLTLLGSTKIPPHQHAQMRRESQRLILCGADIICTTLSSCVNGQMLSSNLYFNICIVDEATQCTEPDTLMPLMLGISKLILVGDPQQLPATVISQSSKKYGFQRSLFSRIESCLEHESFSPIKKLIIQYRMHPDICHFPNRFFYGGSLLSFKSAHDKQNTLQPYVVFGLNFLQNQNFSNIKEAEFVVSLASTAVRLTTQLNYTVGIITPYQSQKTCISNLLKQKSTLFINRFVDINTIDSIQGQERDIVILSLVRSDGIGFLAEFERLNVALTRAKQSLFVCGNFSSLKKHDMWSAFMKDAQDRNFFRDAHNVSTANYDKILQTIAK